MPTDRKRARSYVIALGMEYERIHPCINGCILYRNQHAHATSCPVCAEPRYKSGISGTQLPRKVLRHFPLIPRIQHMFKSKTTVELLTWHANHRSKDGMMRVPTDSPAWKHIETQWPEFGLEPRHFRLGLASDGVNPFGTKSTSWSTWPVVIVTYNIPPW
ncbi:hypothetical protein L7F22_045540 [Adiantum nelumboides]|nr:hypothetical protein [Adiantum nelumboides]